MDYLHAPFHWLLDTVFPHRCLGCRRLTDSYICKKCFRTLPLRRKQECIGCHSITPLGVTCPNCRPHTAVDQLIATSSYHDRLVAGLIGAWKYKFIEELGAPLSALVRKQIAYLAHHRRFSIFQDNPLVVPVPLTPYRRRWRGFNQSEQLATIIADTFQLHMASALVRSRRSAPQAQIEDRAERLTNVAACFQHNPAVPVAGHDIILVDDVCTTGATLDACAQVLKSAGAQTITALVIARG